MQVGFFYGELFRAFLAYAIIVFPACLLSRRYYGTKSSTQQFLMGNIWGISLSVYLISIVGHFSLHLFYYVLFFAYVFLFLICQKYCAPKAKTVLTWEKDYILALAGLVFLVRFIPLLFVDLPHGTDPSFHLVFVQKILNENVLPKDWLPFESIPLNYSLGMHSFLALIADVSGVAPHQIFKLGFALFPALAVGLLTELIERISGSKAVALWSSLSWAFFAFWGGLEFFSWGGLPTLMGATVFLGLLLVILDVRQKGAFGITALLLVSVISIHNHSGLSALLVLVGYCLVSLATERKIQGLTRDLLFALLSSIFLGAHIVFKYIRDFLMMDGETGLFRFYEGLISFENIIEATGPYFFCLIVPGLFLFIRVMKSEEEYFWLTWFCILFGFFVGLEYVYRFVVYFLEGEFYTALTPSRFLTICAFPAAFFAGTTINFLMRWLKEFRFQVILGAFLTLGMGWYAYYILERHAHPLGDIDFEAMQWIKENTPEDAFFLNNNKWFPYLTWREGTLTPLPSSERRKASSVLFKRETLGDFDEFLSWQKDFSRSIYRLEQPGHQLMGRFKEVFRTKETVVYVWQR